MNLRAIYPLRGLPNQGQLWSWISFDVANQSFTLLINTVLFSRFFTEVVVKDKANASTLWSLVYATSMLLVVVASPVAGAMTDRRAWKKEGLILSGLACALLTCALALVPPGGLWIAVLIYIPANFCFNLGENFLASFLPELVKREHVARASGFSWACAYLAALVLLAITAASIEMFKLENPTSWKPLFVFAGLWFVAFGIPTALFLRESATPRPGTGNALADSLRTLVESARRTVQFRDLATLLAGSFLYGVAMNVIVSFASILVKELGFDTKRGVYFIAVITLSGVFGTLIPAFLQDRVGHKRTVIGLLTLWLFSCAGFAYYALLRSRVAPGATFPTWLMWLFANLIGFGLGSLGSANRAFVSFLTPPSRAGEVFGLWGLVFKLAAVGTVPFGVVKDRMGMPASLLVLAGFIAAGIIVTSFVNERRGVRAAEEPARGAPDAPV
jgi:UMF1 family MFS transporter